MMDAIRIKQIILDIYREKYSPDQPRIPAGDPEGGQWSSEGGGWSKTISDLSESIRNSKTEKLYIFDLNGNLIDKSEGGETEVDYYKHSDLKDTITLHNHPINPDRDAYGQSFSYGDVENSIELGVAEMIVVAPDYTYTMKFDPSIREDRSFAIKFMADAAEERVNVHLMQIEKGLGKADRMKEREHIVWSRMSSKYPQIKYTRIGK